MLFEIIAGIILFFILWSIIEQKLLATTSYTISSQKLGKQFNDTSFVVLADLHNLSFGKANEKLCNRIDKLKPEFIIVAGDLVTKHKECIPGNAYYLLEKLVRKYPVYYAYGNHEQYFELLDPAKNETENSNVHNEALYSSWVAYKDRLSSLGVIFLNNKSTLISGKKSGISVTGITLSNEAYCHGRNMTFETSRDILKALSVSVREDDYKILIAHNPMYFKDYAPFKADLILSGHMHGGIVRIPFLGGIISPQYRLFPKYASGLIKENNQSMIVSRGLGTHSYMPRLFNKPELVYIRLKTE